MPVKPKTRKRPHSRSPEYMLSDVLRIYKLPIIAISLGLVVAILVLLLLVGNNFKTIKKNFLFTSSLEAGIIQSRFRDVIDKATDKTIATSLHVLTQTSPAESLQEAVDVNEIKAVYLVNLDKNRKIERYYFKGADDETVGRLTEGILTNDYMQKQFTDLVIVKGKTSQTMLNSSVTVNGKQENFLIVFFGFVMQNKTYALMYFIEPKELIRNAIQNETNKTSSNRNIYLIKKYEDGSYGVITEYFRPTNVPEDDAEKSYLIQKQIGAATFQHSLDIDLIGEKFGIVHIPTSQYLSTTANFGVWVVFFSILGITMMAGYLFFYLVTFNVRSIRLVDIKTKQLVMAKNELESKNDQLKEINTELEDFTYIVSHDIRSPLVNILGFSEEIKLSTDSLKQAITEHAPKNKALKEESEKILDKEITESLLYIDKAVKSLDTLTSTILDYLRSDKGLTQIELVDANEVVSSVLARYSHQIKSRGIDVSIGSLPEVTADRISLQEVFSNIIDNAIKYMRKNVPGTIRIRGRYIPTMDCTLFAVWDNGTGIPKEVKSKVFQIMRRATLDKTIPGHGMGMPFVKSIIKKHKGKIWFKSLPGKGTVFFFYIPNDINI